jgi:4-diphosphocytidyl-2-C-methyl-D-erythritol kinase
MKFLSPAKVNLVLKVTGKDPADGYHFIESIFDPVSLYDVLDVRVTKEPGIRITDMLKALSISQEQNIIYKVLKKVMDMHAVKKGITIKLYKHIPDGAGLGGGSSNAATAIKAANRLFKLKMSEKKMTETAYSVGSDVPFFIKCRPAFVSGKGDKIRVLSKNNSNWYVIAVHSSIRVSTKEAYKWLDVEKNLTKAGLYTNIVYGNSGKRRVPLHNDFETAVYRKYPELLRLKEDFLIHGCLDASLSGSGSAVFALFDSRRGAMECYRKMRREWEGSFICLAHSI